MAFICDFEEHAGIASNAVLDMAGNPGSATITVTWHSGRINKSQNYIDNVYVNGQTNQTPNTKPRTGVTFISTCGFSPMNIQLAGVTKVNRTVEVDVNMNCGVYGGLNEALPGGGSLTDGQMTRAYNVNNPYSSDFRFTPGSSGSRGGVPGACLDEAASSVQSRSFTTICSGTDAYAPCNGAIWVAHQ
jgi:hypothetical protein